MLLTTFAVSAVMALAACTEASDASLVLGDECVEGVTVSADGGQYSFTYTAVNCSAGDIHGSCSADWISGVDTGIPGVVFFTAEQNLVDEGREAVILLEYPGSAIEVLVLQEGFARPEIVVESGSPIGTIAPGGLFEIAYVIENEDVLGTLAVSVSDSTWITDVNTKTRGLVTVWLTPNVTDSDRSGSVTLTYTYPEGESVVEVPVTQSAREYDREFAAKFIHGFYYGELETPGLYDYFFYFCDLGFDDQGYAIPWSTCFGVYIQSETEWTDMEHIGLPEGTYKFAPTYGAADTFTNGWLSYYYYNPETFDLTESWIYDGGILTVTKNGNELCAGTDRYYGR